ncbi:Os09g0506600 [Oryza sativa Japonica Group]|uniref:Uncharacterized protein n=2 Tax=Oryza sativa subsp. japonica TaxID=39947 RepID=A0A8J8YPT6_ORYSJ|nr:hypothetical protein OsJ_29940 [Oryza sativa Japonica Group]KAF2916952.1 hypothetical protein DAI22_09g157400 [Oryza sativa Japonica Group]BAT08864.1 Os09g0506600 [Oryza sativa Japonica Group]
MALVVLAITSLAEAEAVARELGGPHSPHVDVRVESVVLSEAPAMAAIMYALFDDYGWLVGNLDRLLDLAGVDEHLSIVADVNLPRLARDVHDPNALARLRDSAATIIRLARRVGGPSTAAYTNFGNRITKLAHHIQDPNRSVLELRGRLGEAATRVNLLRSSHFDF